MEYGFTRLAVGIPRLALADCRQNLEEHKRLIEEADTADIDVLTLPELSLTGTTCGDLFLQTTLLEQAEEVLRELLVHTRKFRPLFAVGLPVKTGGRLFNCVALLAGGVLLGVVPKSCDKNPFSSAQKCDIEEITLAGETVPFGADLRFQCENFPMLTIGVETGNNTSNPVILLNPAADPEQVGTRDLRKNLVSTGSLRRRDVTVYAGAGMGESSTDQVFSGQGLIAECGNIQLETERFQTDSLLAYCDIDLELLEKERLRNPRLQRCSTVRNVPFSLAPSARPLIRKVSPMPFLPEGSQDTHLEEIFAIQIAALRRRFEAANSKTAILGISGGLDSTLALLVTVGAFDCMGKNRGDIIGVTMPGFGTTDKTYKNALRLMESLGITWHEIPITKSVLQHFADIEHNPDVHDTTYENAQARERTQILMDLANKEDGLVIGTGNLSELALGFTTYGGDHLSMYAVNCGVPKTIVRLMVPLLAKSGAYPDIASQILRDIAKTPISPELLPPDKSGKIKQRTEDLIGPYALHDFFLYYVLRYGFSPRKIVYLAESAFTGTYERPEIIKWLKRFYRRFFTQQFKRSCMPDGPEVGSVSLSPRGGWHMPSDAVGTAWLGELEGLE